MQETSNIRHKWKNRLKKLLLILGSTIFIILVLEGVARLGFSSYKPLRGHHGLFCEHDPLLGWRHKFTYTALFVQTEHESTLRFNSQGIRGPEYSLEKSVDEYRIAILGDSFAEGYTVEFEELFSEVLEHNLIERTSRSVEVINFGVGGYSTDQELLLYQQKVKDYNPDLTIIMFQNNDVWYNNKAYYSAWGRGKKPLFRLDNRELILTNVPVPQPTSRPLKFSEKVKTVLNEHSYLYRWIRDKIKSNARLYSLAVALKIAELPYSEEGELIPKEFGIFQQTYSPEVCKAWEITEALLAKFKEETNTSGSELLVFYVPQQAVVYADRWEMMKQYYNLTESEWNNDKCGQELTNILERLEIKFLNPVEQMRQLENNHAHSGGRLYFQYDGHWNSKGHHFAGEIIAEYIKANFFGFRGFKRFKTPIN